MTTNHTQAERGERVEVTQEDREAIPQDIMLSIPAYMHRSIFKAVAQVRIAARNAALEELRSEVVVERAARALFCCDEGWSNDRLDGATANYWFSRDGGGDQDDQLCKEICDDHREHAAQALDAAIQALSTQQHTNGEA